MVWVKGSTSFFCMWTPSCLSSICWLVLPHWISVLDTSPVSGNYINGIIQICNLLWLVSFTKHKALLVHPCCCMHHTLPLFSHQYSILWTHHISCIHSSADRYVDCFQFWPIMTNAAIKYSYTNFWVNICFNFLGYIPRSGIAE